MRYTLFRGFRIYETFKGYVVTTKSQVKIAKARDLREAKAAIVKYQLHFFRTHTYCSESKSFHKKQ